MNRYSITILTASVVGGIINSLVDSKSPLKKYVNYLVSLVCIVSIVAPIGGIIGNISNLKDTVTNYLDKIFVSEKIESGNSLIINSGKEKICEGIKNTLIDKYNFNEKEVIVDLIIDSEDIQALKIQEINIILTGKASWHDVENVQKYLEGTIGGQISVTRK